MAPPLPTPAYQGSTTPRMISGWISAGTRWSGHSGVLSATAFSMLVASPVGAARIDLDTGWRFRLAKDASAALSWLQGDPAGANRIVVAADDRPGFATSQGYAMRGAGSGSVWFAGFASADSARTDILANQIAATAAPPRATAKVSARRLGRLTPFTVTGDIVTEGARAGVVRAYEPFEAGSAAYPPDPAHLPKDP